MFGGPTGVFRLLQTGLGDQAGWLLGFSAVAAVALLVITRLRRNDPRTGWLLALGGALFVSAAVFSFASGIFHPYYVSFLAPFAAAFVGAGAGLALERRRRARVVAPLAIAGGVVTELVVLGETQGQLAWAVPVVVAVCGCCAVALGLGWSSRVRTVLVGAALAALLAAPAVWAAETLGHATSATFPTGGPASAAAGGPGGGQAGPRGSFAGSRSGGFAGPPAGGFAGGPPGGSAGRPSGGFARRPPGGSAGSLLVDCGQPSGAAPAAPAHGPEAREAPAASGPIPSTVTAAVRYASSHGGGTVGVESQSSAASAILSENADVAGLGGFSGPGELGDRGLDRHRSPRRPAALDPRRLRADPAPARRHPPGQRVGVRRRAAGVPCGLDLVRTQWRPELG